MAFLNFVKIWEDVLNPSLDEKTAPSLGSVYLNKEDKIYVDSTEFFKRTLITRDMIEALENIVNVFTGKGGNKILLLNSLFGGGKTHTLLTIYHAFKNPKALLNASAESDEIKRRLENIIKDIEKLGKVRLVVIDGHSDEVAPGPDHPLNLPANLSIKTIWGMIAYQLGLYDKVRDRDEQLIAPRADTLVELLGKEPVLILMDEIAYYLVLYKKAGNQTYRDYGSQITLFLEALAEAIKIVPKAVLVISMPISVSGNEFSVEDSYKDSESDIRALYKVVSRVAARELTPVSPSNISNILKVRIFKEIDREKAKVISKELYDIYSREEFKQFFGSEAHRLAEKVIETYPFHPTYIDTLVEIVNNHEKLEKTRDAIRLTRKVVRKLYNEKSNAELIMPYHLDIEDNEFQGILLSTSSYRGYISAIQTDIMGKARSYDKPELAKVVAKTIFIRSFVYGDFNKNLRVYPTKQDIIVSSYEPYFVKSNKLQPNDFTDAIEWESSNLTYLVKQGDRYWFTQIMTPAKLIEERAKQVDNITAIGKVKEIAEKLLTRTPKDIQSNSRKVKSPSKSIFDAENSKVLEKAEPIDFDDKKYILAVSLSIPSQSDLEELIYRTPKGGQRVNANTVYVVFPKDDESMNRVVNFAKSLVACDEISDKELEGIYSDATIRKVMQGKLEELCYSETGTQGKLISNLISALSKIAYPHYDNGNTVKIETMQFTDTLIQSAESTLKSISPPKYLEELDFDYLDYLLSNKIHISLSEITDEKKVSDIIDYFYTNPALPMVSEEKIKSALRDGYEKLKFGIRRKGKLYFKKIYSCEDQNCQPPPESEAEDINGIEPDDYIVPSKLALKEQLSNLKPEENKLSDGVLRIWYEVYDSANNKYVKLDEALNVYDQETLIKLPIVKKKEFLQEGIDVKLEKNEIEVKPEEEVVINGIVEGIGIFKGELKLSASIGEVSPSQFTLDENKRVEKVTWKFSAPKDDGDYMYSLTVYKDSQALKSLSVKVRVKRPSAQISKIVPPRETKVSTLTIQVEEPNFKPLSILMKKFSSICKVSKAEFSLETNINDMNSKLCLCLEDTTVDDLQTIIAMISRYSMGLKKISYTVTLKPRFGNYFNTPSFTPDEEKELQKYISYEEYKG